MSSTCSSPFKQYLRAKGELESSMSNARALRDQWLAALNENPTNLTRKEVEHIGKAFKNRLLTIKWDCEDLEELVNVCTSSKGSKFQKNESLAATCFIADCRNEATKLMEQLEEIETNSRLYNKHGIALPSITNQLTSTVTSSLIQSAKTNSDLKYERLLDENNNNNNNRPDSGEEIQFDKSRLVGEGAPSVFNNALYDHLEHSDQFVADRMNERNMGNFNQVFNNPTRPVTNVYMNPNDNELILDMLETEYYNAPSGLQANNSKFNYTMISKILETDRNKFLGTIAFLFSFPLLFVFFMFL